MTKHRRTKRRSQKGGLFGFEKPEDPNAPSFWSKLSGWGTSAVEKTKEVGSNLDTGLGNMGTQASTAVSSTFSSASEGLSSLNPFGSNTTTLATTPPVTTPPVTTPPPSTYSTTVLASGGRRRKRSRSMKGGKGGLGLTYYAAPVSGLKVAEPTTLQFYANGTNQYSVKGGSRRCRGRGRKGRRTRRHKRR